MEEAITPTNLQDHIYETYFWLRRGLCLRAFVFPLLLLGIGWWKDIPLQGSMSEYYFAFAPPTSELRVFPGRVVFVGILFVFGVFLMLYRGFSNTENWALNIAGLSTVVAALFPMQPLDYCNNCGTDTYSFVHAAAGVVLFLCVAFVAWACTEETLVQLPDPKRQYFRNGYYALAIAMIAVPVAVLVMTYFFKIYDKKIFFVEWVGIWLFASYWALKKLSLSDAEKKAMGGQMQILERPAKKPSLRQRASRLLD